MELLDNTVRVNGGPSDERDPIVLFVPIGVKAPVSFPFKVEPWDLRDFIARLPALEGVTVQEVDPNLLASLIKIANEMGVEMKALRGMEGDYPSYFLMSTTSLPQVTVAEIMLLQEESVAAGGDGMKARKKDGAKHRNPAADNQSKIAEMADKEWEANAGMDE